MAATTHHLHPVTTSVGSVDWHDSEPLPCDVVFRWVNAKDGESALTSEDCDKGRMKKGLSKASNGECDMRRFRDNDELRFSIRSFVRLRGIQNVHVVAKGAPPAWLDVSHPRIFWHNETALLEALRVERGIARPLAVRNGEPAKLAIARAPHLAERFVLADDDYFIVPRAAPTGAPEAGGGAGCDDASSSGGDCTTCACNSSSGSSRSNSSSSSSSSSSRRHRGPLHASSSSSSFHSGLFFGADGVPFHPEPIWMAHRPVPMLRDAYVAEVNALSNASVASILTSGVKRVDVLPMMCKRMRAKGQARPVVTLTRSFAAVVLGKPHPSGCNWTVASTCSNPRKAREALYTNFWLSFQSHAVFDQVAGFFADVRTQRPFMMCVNDDWPLHPTHYASTIAAFRDFVASELAPAEAWEKDRSAPRGWATQPPPRPTHDGYSSTVPLPPSAKDHERASQHAPSSGGGRDSSGSSGSGGPTASAGGARTLSQSPPGDGGKQENELDGLPSVAATTTRGELLVNATCAGSGHNLTLPARAFDLPPHLTPLLEPLTPQARQRLRTNPQSLSADELTASISHLDLVDIDNSIAPASGGGEGGGEGGCDGGGGGGEGGGGGGGDGEAEDVGRGATGHAHATKYAQLAVGYLNAERGRHWCELAVQIRRTPALRAVDVWVLNEFDLGMARSSQQHTARLFAYALGLNYAWAVEFVELSNGNKAEQARTKGQENRYGLHGNAILSRWPLRDARVVRMPGMAPLYSSKGFETAYGYEKRLGGRMTLFAHTAAHVQGGPRPTHHEPSVTRARAEHGVGAAASRCRPLLVASTHAQTVWGGLSAHTTPAIAAMRAQIERARERAAQHEHDAAAAAVPAVILGGDTWASTCRWIGLSSLVPRSSPKAVLDRQGKVQLTRHSGMDDYICAGNLTAVGEPIRVPGRGQPLHGGAEFVLCDHVMIRATVAWSF